MDLLTTLTCVLELTVAAQICWYLAAVVQTQLCKYYIEIGDTLREQTVWGEINALRWAFPVKGFYARAA